MTRDKLKEELSQRIALYCQEDDIDSDLSVSISNLIDQYHDEIAVMVQIAIESEAETIAARVRDAIKEVPCNLSY